MMLGKSWMNTITHLHTLWNNATNDARTILGKSWINTIMHLCTLWNDAMNDVWTILEWCWANPERIQLWTVLSNAMNDAQMVLWMMIVIYCGTIHKVQESQVSQLIPDYSLDIIVPTETWLNSNYDLWKDTCTLNKAQLRLHTVDRKEGWGGSLALINRYQYKGSSAGTWGSMQSQMLLQLSEFLRVIFATSNP